MKGQQSHHIKLQEQEENNNFTNSTPQIDSSTPNFLNYPHHPSFLSAPPHLLPTNQYQNTQNTPVQNTPAKRPKITPTTSSDDNSTIDSTRKSTGRPRGSKNKPKSPIIITQKPEPGLTPYIIELPSGSDLVTRLTRLTRQRGVSLCVISATGSVGDVTLMQSSTSVPGGTVLFRGKFDILSLSACLLVNNTAFDCGFNGVFSVTLSGPHGQIVGGKVVGPLVCVGTVYVVASSFSNPEYTKLPMQVGNQSDGDGDGDCKMEIGVGVGGGYLKKRGSSGDGDGDCKMEIGGGYLNNRGSSGDVVWTPAPLAARPPQPQPPLN